MLSQIIIVITGVLAVWLSQDACESRRRFACLFGMAGQPFWFYSTYQAEQWGIFALSFLYTFAWIKGIKVYWWDKWRSGNAN